MSSKYNCVSRVYCLIGKSSGLYVFLRAGQERTPEITENQFFRTTSRDRRYIRTEFQLHLGRVEHVPSPAFLGSSIHISVTGGIRDKFQIKITGIPCNLPSGSNVSIRCFSSHDVFSVRRPRFFK